MKALPNLLTASRLLLSLVLFLALAAAGGATPWFAGPISGPTSLALERWAFVAFVVAAITDFFDGWLARRLAATSLLGAILDPIADKILVAAAALGLMALAPDPSIVIPLGFILFREFAVSALREVCAGRGVKLPVTLLAKWKTTLQLLALGAELLTAAWAAFGLPDDPGAFAIAAHALLWIAATVTLVTGVQYALQAARALRAPTGG